MEKEHLFYAKGKKTVEIVLSQTSKKQIEYAKIVWPIFVELIFHRVIKRGEQFQEFKKITNIRRTTKLQSNSQFFGRTRKTTSAKMSFYGLN